MGRDSAATNTLHRRGLPPIERRNLVLVAVIDGHPSEYPLPTSGEVTIGRGEEASIRIAHASLSRLHVVLAIGDEVVVRELASKNGTRAHGERLAPGAECAIAIGGDDSPGDVFEPGALVCFVLCRDKAAKAPLPAAGSPDKPLRVQLDALERERIVEALNASGGNQTKAAKLLKMPRRTFVLRLETYGIPRPRKRD